MNGQVICAALVHSSQSTRPPRAEAAYCEATWLIACSSFSLGPLAIPISCKSSSSSIANASMSISSWEQSRKDAAGQQRDGGNARGIGERGRTCANCGKNLPSSRGISSAARSGSLPSGTTVLLAPAVAPPAAGRLAAAGAPWRCCCWCCCCCFFCCAAAAFCCCSCCCANLCCCWCWCWCCCAAAPLGPPDRCCCCCCCCCPGRACCLGRP